MLTLLATADFTWQLADQANSQFPSSYDYKN